MPILLLFLSLSTSPSLSLHLPLNLPPLTTSHNQPVTGPLSASGFGLSPPTHLASPAHSIGLVHRPKASLPQGRGLYGLPVTTAHLSTTRCFLPYAALLRFASMIVLCHACIQPPAPSLDPFVLLWRCDGKRICSYTKSRYLPPFPANIIHAGLFEINHSYAHEFGLRLILPSLSLELDVIGLVLHPLSHVPSGCAICL
eukprot:scaffold833_cov352-Pavlova_lutheri.AAC.20